MPSDSSVEVKELLEEFWNWRLEQSPEFATSIANHSFDNKLDSYSLDSFAKRKEACIKFNDRAAAFLKNSQNPNDVLNLELFQDNLKTYVDGLKVEGYLNPINCLEGVHIDFERLVSYMAFNTEQDYLKLIERLLHFPKQVDEIIELLSRAIQLKRTNHALSMIGVVNQMKIYQNSDAEKTPFYKPFLSMPDSISKNKQQHLQKVAQDALNDEFLPQILKLADFIETKYLPNTRPQIAASSLPDGAVFYQQCLKFHLGLDLTPSEVHNMGIQEVERISKEMDKIINSLGLSLTKKQFAEQLRTNKDHFCKSKEELLKLYQDIVENEITPQLGNLFHIIPAQKLSIEHTPASMSAGPQAYYLAGSPDGVRPGVFYVNTADVNSSPKYESECLALHEALPGHHLQMAYMMEQDGIPEFRRFLEDRKYSDAPSRFPLYTAYIEGWGLYSEYLGHELGLYTDPYMDYGHLSQEMFRACRLVVDTGMHALGWSRDKAVEYMLTHSAATKPNIEKEINRYITWPGQACAYKVGEITIKTLRQRAAKELGAKFDIKDFHEVVLRSMGSLSFLEKQIDEYISKNK